MFCQPTSFDTLRSLPYSVWSPPGQGFTMAVRGVATPWPCLFALPQTEALVDSRGLPGCCSLIKVRQRCIIQDI